ncbi:proline-rich protein 5-like isoform X1 [Salvelinus fontinalis]|uniref:proline-rich protein 5-like isoform X1 n=1 Tax=Salvelinus fontinalis TaxID=8038 RepID=UPI0024851EEF|nr:proline-rich protein 5-like isoform X1 [Salvelinus fontinalis]
MSSPWNSSMSNSWPSVSEASSSLSLSNLEDGSLSGSKSLKFAQMATNFSILVLVSLLHALVCVCVCSQTRTSEAADVGGIWRRMESTGERASDPQSPFHQVADEICWHDCHIASPSQSPCLEVYFARLPRTLPSSRPSVQTAVIKVFQGGGLQANELYTLNESIRWLLKTELGSFITEYFQNQLLTKGLSHILEKIRLYEGDSQLLILSEMWIRFFTAILPTLQAIFYPVQGQELTVRQMALLGFRDLVLLKLSLEDLLPIATVPPAITQMLLILQGIHESNGPSQEYYQLEGLVETVISPYLGNVLHVSNTNRFVECRAPLSRLRGVAQPEITVTHHHASDSSSLAPLVEQEGESYLEKVGGVRRHTVANAHSDIRLLSASGRMQPGMEEDSGGGGGNGMAGNGMRPRPFSSYPDILESPMGVVGPFRKQRSTEISCHPPS